MTIRGQRISCVVLGFVVACAAAAQPVDVETSARLVFAKIVRASGVSGQPPQFEIQSEAQRKANKLKRQIAWYDYSTNTIGIDRKTLDLCTRMSDTDSCIAVFLGHELAHFYKDHRWGGDFGSRFATTDIGVKIRALSGAEVLIYETQADDTGGIYSYLAGYNTLALAPATLNAVYAAYQLPADLQGYPTLTERKQIAQKSAARLEALLPVFDAGTLLLALGRYEDAARCFDYVGETFPGGAVLNNAGVAYMLAAAGLFPREAHATAYPWTLDGESRLEPRPSAQSKGAVSETREDKRKRLVDLAEARFSEAIRRDAAYQPAVLNLAFLEHLTGRRGTARDRLAQSKQTAAKAIADADGPPALGAAPAERVAEVIESTEKIGGLSPSQIAVKQLAVSAKIKSDAPGTETLSVFSKRMSTFWELQIQSGSWHAGALVTGAGFKGETALHVQIGSPWADALKAYGTPSSKQVSELNQMAVFEDAGVGFVGTEKVEKILVFAVGQ